MSGVLRVTSSACFPFSRQRHRTGEVSKYPGVDTTFHSHLRSAPLRLLPLCFSLPIICTEFRSFLVFFSVSSGLVPRTSGRPLSIGVPHHRPAITRVVSFSSSQDLSCCSLWVNRFTTETIPEVSHQCVDFHRSLHSHDRRTRKLRECFRRVPTGSLQLYELKLIEHDIFRLS